MPAPGKTNLLKTVLTIVLSIAVAAFFMWLAFRDLDFRGIAEYFRRADYRWVGISAVFGLLAYWFRAVRWNLLFEPLGYRITTKASLWSLSFGYLMNLTIPRSGELARATALYGVEQVPADKSFGTVILERIVDLCCLLVFLLLTIIFKYDAILSFGRYISEKRASGEGGGWFRWVIGGIVLLFILIFAFRQKLAQYSFFNKIFNIARGLGQGITSIFRLKQPGKFLIYTILIWLCYYLASYLIIFALPETSTLSPADGLYIIVVGTLGMIIPASGGIGAFHYALKIGIGALFLSMGLALEDGEKAGLAYAFISHTMQLVLIVVMGFISIPVLASMRKSQVS